MRKNYSGKTESRQREGGIPVCRDNIFPYKHNFLFCIGKSGQYHLMCACVKNIKNGGKFSNDNKHYKTEYYVIYFINSSDGAMNSFLHNLKFFYLILWVTYRFKGFQQLLFFRQAFLILSFLSFSRWKFCLLKLFERAKVCNFFWLIFHSKIRLHNSVNNEVVLKKFNGIDMNNVSKLAILNLLPRKIITKPRDRTSVSVCRDKWFS